MTPEELDAIAISYERRWGLGRLPRLVSAETATKWATALALLESDWPPAGQTWEAVRASLARGWAALEAEATARGHAPLPGPVAEAEWEKGRVFAVALDGDHKQALEVRAKQDGRQHYSVWTVAEIAKLIAAIPLVGDIKDTWPGAEIMGRPQPRPVGKMPDDDIPFGAWGAGDKPAGWEARQ